MTVRCFSLSYDHISAARLQRNITRFPRTSGIFNPRNFIVKVPSNYEDATAKVKHGFKIALRQVAEFNNSPSALFLGSKLKIARKKGPTLSNLVTSHIQIARDISWEDFISHHFDLPPAGIEQCLMCGGVRKSLIHFDLPSS